MRGEFLDIGGARLYYYASGSRSAAPPVLLLHGFGTSSHLWSGLVPLIAAQRRVIVLDLLGFGRSDRPGSHPVNLRGHADRAIQLLELLQVPAACAVGHGMGGGVAQLMAVRTPERVSHLGLIGAVAYNDWPPATVRLVRSLPSVMRRLPGSWLLALLRHEMRRGFRDPTRATHTMDRYLRPFAGSEGRDALLEHLSQLDPADTQSLSQHLGDIAAPTAVIWGDEDRLVHPCTGERLASDIPGATPHRLPGIAHFAPEEAPEAVCAILMELFER